MTHWFPLGLDALRHKNEVLDGLLRGDRPRPGDDRADDGGAGDRRRRPRRRPRRSSSTCRPSVAPHVTAGTPEQAAEALRPYLDAGFTGFTFNNTIYRTPEQIAVVGELLRMVDQRLRPRSDPPIGPTLPVSPATPARHRGRAGSGGTRLRRRASADRLVAAEGAARGCPPPSTGRAALLELPHACDRQDRRRPRSPRSRRTARSRDRRDDPAPRARPAPSPSGISSERSASGSQTQVPARSRAVASTSSVRRR